MRFSLRNWVLRQYLSGKLKEKVNSSSLLIYFKNLTITVRSAFFPFSDSLVNFRKQNVFIVIKSNLSICCFIDCAFGIMSKNYSPCPSSRRLLPIYSYKYFIVLHLNLFPFLVNFWTRLFILRLYLPCGYLNAPALFIKNTILSPLSWRK